MADIREGEFAGAGASGLGLDVEWPSSLGVSTSGSMLLGFWLLAGPHLSIHKGPKDVWPVTPTADLWKILQEGSELVALLYSQDVEFRQLKKK